MATIPKSEKSCSSAKVFDYFYEGESVKKLIFKIIKITGLPSSVEHLHHCLNYVHVKIASKWKNVIRRILKGRMLKEYSAALKRELLKTILFFHQKNYKAGRPGMDFYSAPYTFQLT